ncbi:TetR/AcrR family transcriptional regulator [Cohnella thermotolerans]|uniref:TetR/AcrR family transcriptional regulator n=1 Tax=Cohnella thermotolerans TaxID=329858 RepID=UPI0004030A70|nr:TetR/AcrR family transcriptional regulator [Cohnella thermotolerans]
MSKDDKTAGRQSFIAEARREQIMEAAIQTLDEIGYVNASLSQIAKRAGISTALISYHFADKGDLMNQLLMNLLERSTSYILERVNRERTSTGKLHAFIVASLAYQGAHPSRYAALVEIVFNARTPDNVPYYKVSDDDEDPMMRVLLDILREGQNNGEFADFHLDVMASMIQGAIGEYMLSSPVTRKVSLETYSDELVKMVTRAIQK